MGEGALLSFTHRLVVMSEEDLPDDIDFPPSCRLCGKSLELGTGDAYLVNVEAMADPSPPRFSNADLQRDLDRSFSEVFEELSQLSAQEAMDQVYRRVSFFLCVRCYTRWIEDPTGSP